MEIVFLCMSFEVIYGLNVSKSYLVHVIIYENMIASFLSALITYSYFLLACFKGPCAIPTERPDSGSSSKVIYYNF